MVCHSQLDVCWLCSVLVNVLPVEKDNRELYPSTERSTCPQKINKCKTRSQFPAVQSTLIVDDK